MNVIGIQAHSNSTRLPGKIYMEIGGKSLLQWCVESCREIAQTWVLGCVTDEKLIQHCCDRDIPLYIGKCDDQDVLSRYVKFARAVGSSSVTRVTSDCPFISVPDLAYTMTVHSKGNDFTSNAFAPRTTPDGYDVECISRRLLEHLDNFVNLIEMREHVTQFVYQNEKELGKQFRVCRVKSLLDLSDQKYSIDKQEDFDRVKAMVRV